MGRGVLVIGYGNVLRTDDGVGWRIAEALADDPRLTGVTVIGRHQLTPELALDVSEADRVVLVDASVGPPAGSFVIERVEAAAHRAGSMSHQLDPGNLVALAGALYGGGPDVFLVSVGADSFEAGEGLSPAVEAALPAVIEAVVALAGATGDRALAAVAGRSHA